MAQKDSTQYYCDSCKKNKRIKINTNQDAPVVRNGLRVQTYVHRCLDGSLKVINLHIDGNFDTRSHEFLKLPQIEEPKDKIISNLPVPKIQSKRSNEWKNILVTHIPPFGGLRIIVEDSVLKAKIKVGDINEKIEEPLFILNSNLNTVRLQYFSKSISPNENTRNWFEGFINIMERLPPSNLGEIIETLKYIQQLCTEEMTEEDVEIIKMIISAEDITFEIINEFDPDHLIDKQGLPKYNADTIKKIVDLMTYIQYHPDHTLQDYTVSHLEDITYLIRLFNILEEKQFIKIHRPDLILV